MSELTLYHGNKNYSSWSMRAWLALKLSGAPFTEVGFHLGEPGVREKIRPYSPTAKVPALHDGDLVIWDSLAIGEYLAERYPQARIWPPDPAARATARSVVAEMHSLAAARPALARLGRGPRVRDPGRHEHQTGHCPDPHGRRRHRRRRGRNGDHRSQLKAAPVPYCGK